LPEVSEAAEVTPGVHAGGVAMADVIVNRLLGKPRENDRIPFARLHESSAPLGPAATLEFNPAAPDGPTRFLGILDELGLEPQRGHSPGYVGPVGRAGAWARLEDLAARRSHAAPSTISVAS
jgi:hypothetical protein